MILFSSENEAYGLEMFTIINRYYLCYKNHSEHGVLSQIKLIYTIY
jgi:hypothetical protein